ncbi:MAG: hypothetical protein EBZ55_03550 [Actinobacteria bacterium]|nr:hypothetical protein [Actinomycetota bacterium]
MDEVRDSIGVGNGGLGLALLGGGLGGILGSVVGGRVLRPGLILKVLRWSMTRSPRKRPISIAAENTTGPAPFKRPASSQSRSAVALHSFGVTSNAAAASAKKTMTNTARESRTE